MMNRWWIDVALALGALALIAGAMLLGGCSVRPYVEAGADRELRSSAAHNCKTLGYAGAGVSKEWKGGAIEGDLALRHYSCLLKQDHEESDNAVGAHVRIYPRELRKRG